MVRKKVIAVACGLFSSIADAKSSQGKGDGTSASKLVPETAMTCAIEVGYFVKDPKLWHICCCGDAWSEKGAFKQMCP